MSSGRRPGEEFDDTRSYGRGFWLGPAADHVWIEGMDAGVSFRSGAFRTPT